LKTQPNNPLPRELAPGVHWLGQCLDQTYKGRKLHSYQSAYLVIGEQHSALIEQGLTSDIGVIQAQLDELLTPDVPPLKYFFISHHETPHSGGIGRFLHRYPGSIACGNVNDLHLVFPEFADRLQPLDPGDEIDLGGTALRVVEAVFRDAAYTRWAFDTNSRILFSGDGFAYAHVHTEGNCGRLAEEIVEDLELEEMTAIYAFLAFHWTQLVDIEPLLTRLEELLAELDVQLVAPTHGLPFSELDVVMPEIRAGYRAGAEREGRNLFDLAPADEPAA
jgi:flavorubredoxin